MNSGKTERAVFFGSGPVAAKSLELLVDHTEIEAVITKPRPDHHRGSVPVLELAEKLGVPIITASTKKDVDEALESNNLQSRYGILIDFGIIVSRTAIDRFPLGIINSHFSLLPHLRGADPITWSIVNGDSETGVSLMLVDEGMDTGQLLAQRSLPLQQDETTPSLTSSLITMSDDLLREIVPGYLSEAIAAFEQPDVKNATYSRKLAKSDGVIDWNETATQIERKIRAFYGWPQSRTKLNGLDIIIKAAQVVSESGKPGAYDFDGTQLIIYAADNALRIDAVKPAGKKEMPVKAFLAGYSSQL